MGRVVCLPASARASSASQARLVKRNWEGSSSSSEEDDPSSSSSYAADGATAPPTLPSSGGAPPSLAGAKKSLGGTGSPSKSWSFSTSSS
jgi:hypothetical protein